MRKNTNAPAPAKTPRPVINAPFTVTNVWWNPDNTIAKFNIHIPGVTLCNVTLKYKDDKPVLYPSSHKGANEGWFADYFFNFSDEMIADIVDAVESV